jgi:conjugal transfer pilus assembly protein TrbC
MNWFRSHLLLPALFLSLASAMALAQEPSFPGARTDGVRLPTAEDMAKAQQRAREAMGRLTDSGTMKQQYGIAGMPKVEALPKPAAPAPDIASIAEKYKHLGQAAIPQNGQPDLFVMVSLSMPKEALVRTAEQAERAGATLVFRGLKGDSMTKMGEEIKAIVGSRSVSVVVHPPAFQQFGVSRVPTFVLARGDAGNQTLENGCSKPETFVKVSGDVSLDYALDYIERKSQAWAAVAKEYRSRIVRGIN